MQYFAYGSNMNLKHLRAFLHRFGVGPEGVSDPRHVILPDYRLRTNYLTTSGLGAANIEPCPGDAVEGVLLTITTDVQDALRAKEGWKHRYDETTVEVTLPSNGEMILALTYRVTPEHRLPHDAPVSPRYRSLILAGAQDAGLSAEYQEHLRRILKPAPETPMPSPDETTEGMFLLGWSPGDTSQHG